MNISDFTVTVPAALVTPMADEDIPFITAADTSPELAELVTEAAVCLNSIFTTNTGLTAMKRRFACLIVDIRERLAVTKDATGMANVAREQKVYVPLVASIYVKAGIPQDSTPGSIQSGIRGYVSEELIKRGYKDAPAVLTDEEKATASAARIAKTVADQDAPVLVSALGAKLAGDATNPGDAATGVYAVSDLLNAVPFGRVTEDNRDAVHAALVALSAQVSGLLGRFAPVSAAA